MFNRRRRFLRRKLRTRDSRRIPSRRLFSKRDKTIKAPKKEAPIPVTFMPMPPPTRVSPVRQRIESSPIKNRRRRRTHGDPMPVRRRKKGGMIKKGHTDMRKGGMFY